jgi:hypothetical protein
MLCILFNCYSVTDHVFRMCENPGSRYNLSELVHPDASSSIMFTAEAPQLNRFCDASTHNRYAPTKHNLICNRRSISDVIHQHTDFVNRQV